jgi:S1-C subfamily serine protease
MGNMQADEPVKTVFTHMERSHVRVHTPGLFSKGNSVEIHLECLADSQFCFPLPGGKVISAYGSRGGHSGADIKTKANDSILCVFDVVDALGGKFADAGAKLCRELDIKGGVQVVGIKADGILARARVKQGFVITHINDRPVYSLGDMQRMTEKVRSIDGVYPNGRSASYTLVE